ncbi:MAG: deaminase [Minisyncoccia bacterium]
MVTPHYFEEAAEEARKSLCTRSHCGAVIVDGEGVIVGRGYNAPPQDDISIRRCNRKHELDATFKSDKTCCVHAEQRAIMEALKNNSKRLDGATLYFIRLDDNGEMKYSGKPYCTICSKMSLDVGIKYFALYHKGGIGVYGTKEYNELSFAYKE